MDSMPKVAGVATARRGVVVAIAQEGHVWAMGLEKRSWTALHPDTPVAHKKAAAEAGD